MKRAQAMDLAERLWGKAAVIRYQHTHCRDKCMVGTSNEEGHFLWRGAGTTWEGAFSQALSDRPLNKLEDMMEILIP